MKEERSELIRKLKEKSQQIFLKKQIENQMEIHAKRVKEEEVVFGEILSEKEMQERKG